MQVRSLLLCAGLLLAACGEAGNRADDVANANVETGASAVGGGGPAERKRPVNRSQGVEEPAELTLSAAPAQAAEGATITLTLGNGSDERIGYNLCSSGLETGDRRPVPTGNVCTMELRTLEPGGSADYRYRLPLNMVDGSYRFVTQVEWMGSGRRSGVHSNSIEVR